MMDMLSSAKSFSRARRTLTPTCAQEEAQAAALGRPMRRSTSQRSSATGAAPRQRTPPEGRDFVRENIVDAGTHTKEQPDIKDNNAKYLSKANYGRVPSYLHERNMELAANYAKQQVRCCCCCCLQALFASQLMDVQQLA